MTTDWCRRVCSHAPHCPLRSFHRMIVICSTAYGTYVDRRPDALFPFTISFRCKTACRHKITLPIWVSPDLAMVSKLASRLLIRAAQLFSSRFHRKRLTLLKTLFCFVLVWSWILYFILAYVLPGSPALIPASLLFASRPLLVIAHPDDESLFFGPTILSLTQDETKSLTILVLSCGKSFIIICDNGITNTKGNNYGIGSTRKDEMLKACKRLGAQGCTVLDKKDIQDNPTQWWDEDIIIPLVKSWIAKVKADVVSQYRSLMSYDCPCKLAIN